MYICMHKHMLLICVCGLKGMRLDYTHICMHAHAHIYVCISTCVCIYTHTMCRIAYIDRYMNT